MSDINYTNQKKYDKAQQVMRQFYPKSEDGGLHSSQEAFSLSQEFANLNIKIYEANDAPNTQTKFILNLLKLKGGISNNTYYYEINNVSSLAADQNNSDSAAKAIDIEFGKDASNLYFSYMQEANNLALTTLAKYIEELETIHPNLSKPLRLLWDKRVGESDSKLLRAMSVRVGFELLANQNSQNWSDLPEFLALIAVAEMANVQTYTGNILYDQKNPDLDPQFVLNSTKLQQGLVIQRAIKALFKLKPKLNLSDEQIETCLLLFNDLMYQTDQGQFIDNFEPNLQISETALSQTEEDFLKLYSKRGYYMSGIFYGNLVKIGATLAGSNQAHAYILDLWGKVMSDGLQTVNDLFDFLPFKTKQEGQIHKMYKKDLNCPDLWNGKLTYPIFLLLNSCNPLDREWMLSLTKYKAAGKFITDQENERLVKLLFETKTYEKIKSYAGQNVHVAKNALKIFPHSKARLILAYSTNICQKSQYFKHLETLYKSL